LIACPKCGSGISDAARFCSACGEAISSVSQLPTGLASPSAVRAAQRPPSSSRVGRLASSDSIDAGGFTPGLVLAERYRIIGLLGRGGMGEVYRADDLKLGQPVALKFLPSRFAEEKDRLERFYAEVRIARQVSHPNVCRVYDVGEIDGQHYLSMEYVDGEDLASLLKRIGRLPPDKALEISRELCAGLAAAHDRGVLHRDLKPSNVMVDGRGRARITDFGLAVAAGDVIEGEVSGTPAYMAPEQLQGRGASVRSDIYALGLVLYELSTGKKAFDAASFEELKRKHAEQAPTAPSSVAPGFDPAVERVILRCLEKDPALRPSSVAQVAAALPGGDPLAAALAAGETPSPEMVAAAGGDEQVSPKVARVLLATVAVALTALIFFIGKTQLLAAVDSQKSPEVLRARAREILSGLGYRDRPADWAGDLFEYEPFTDWVAANDRSPDRWTRGTARDAIDYRYRESPTSLVPASFFSGPSPGPRVTEYDPPSALQSGTTSVRLDTEGRLNMLEVEPMQFEKELGPSPAPDWTALFRDAGLEMALFKPVEPRWTPAVYADVRAAWEGPHPERRGLTMRVEAAAYHGRPVSFRWIGPWSEPDRDVFDTRSTATQWGDTIWYSILLTLFFGGAWLSRSNLRAGRGDRRGAARLAAAVVACQIVAWAFGAHHVSANLEFGVFSNGISNALAMGVFIWLLYLALEPVARRHWPHMLISWSRLLGGRVKDPLVGRDLLVGAASACLLAILNGPVLHLVPVLFGSAPTKPGAPLFAASARDAMAWAASIPVLKLVWCLGAVFFLVLVRRLVRIEWLAAAVVALLFSVVYLGSSPLQYAAGVLGLGLLVFVTIRFGLLAALTMSMLEEMLAAFVRTADTSAWYFSTGPIVIAVVLAVAIWGYRMTVPVRAGALAEA
jgi:Protein kinase domain/zinc-ribbon domain